MSENKDKTQELLEQLLSELYKAGSQGVTPSGESYLIAEDGQYLGKITSNKFDSQSILNKYGSFGSKYSTTSIFNKYSQYGSRYGTFSVNNPYSSQPPKLYLNGRYIGRVTENKYLSDRIPTDVFLYVLQNDINSLLKGRIPKDEIEVRQDQGESFIIANDGTFLGSLTPNQFDQKSIFNQFGPYGSQFSQTSIFNQFCPYGGQFSQLSPFNQFSQTPPKVYLKGNFVGLLTVNQFLTGNKINPSTIKEWAKERL
ncbi:MAG: hypothetical protein ACK4E0_18965 [Chitinophagaceae bacterium]